MTQKTNPVPFEPFLALLEAHEQATAAAAKADQLRQPHTFALEDLTVRTLLQSGQQRPGDDADTATKPVKKRQHVNNACTNCKRSHLACDHNRPCSRCVRTGRQETCMDFKHRPRGRPPAVPNRSKLAQTLIHYTNASGDSGCAPAVQNNIIDSAKVCCTLSIVSSRSIPNPLL
jgi:hypothetical protein